MNNSLTYKPKMFRRRREKDLLYSQHLVSLIFLAGALSFTLIQPRTKSVPEIFYPFFLIYEEYNYVLILCFFALQGRKTDIM
ncbi:hypothetical protein HZS_4823 [Henneguya salminicola]|nr:hypothetical protein HZS_4823 [Henneguya salminicola]